MTFVAGLDLGQSQDFSALGLIQVSDHGFLDPTPHMGQLLALRYLKRWDLGTPYPQIVSDVKALLERPELSGQSDIVVDGTGVGRPVVDMFYQAGVSAIPVSITGGERVTHEKGWWSVPKRELVSSVAVGFEGSALVIADGLPFGDVLKKELSNFRAKISLAGHDSWEAWREQDHDDMVLAVALACWWANRGAGSNIRVLTW